MTNSDRVVRQFSHEVSLRGLRILLVDDNLAFRNMFRNVLREFKPAAVEAIRDGRQALSRLRIDEVPDPDIIICNLRNSGMDGMRFCNELRRDVHLRKRGIPVVVLTADQTPLVHEVLYQLGVKAVVAKPVSTATLLQQIDAVLRRRRQERLRRRSGPARVAA